MDITQRVLSYMLRRGMRQYMVEYDYRRKVVVLHDRIYPDELLRCGVDIRRDCFAVVPEHLNADDFLGDEQRALESYQKAVIESLHEWVEKVGVREDADIRTLTPLLSIPLY